MKAKIKNPWHVAENPYSKEYYEGEWLDTEWEGYSFIGLPNSVVAVKNGKAITECVTVKGAIRQIKKIGFKL